MMEVTAAAYKEALALQPHPEGGHYCQTYASEERLVASALPARFGGGFQPLFTYCWKEKIIQHFIASKAMSFGIFTTAVVCIFM